MKKQFTWEHEYHYLIARDTILELLQSGLFLIKDSIKITQNG